MRAGWAVCGVMSNRGSSEAKFEITSVLAAAEAEGTTALEKVRKFLDDHRVKLKTGPRAFEEFERELHARVAEFEREVLATEMRSVDIDEPAIEIAGVVHRRVLRQSQTYMTAAGEVVVERTLYKNRADAEALCVSPMELQLGIVGDFWTPRAAQQALWVISQMTPKKGEELFERLGSMSPSKSSLDRLPKEISKRWEEDREAFERALREGLEIPDDAVSITVSLDGVLAPLEGGNRPLDVRMDAAREGRTSKGPAGYREIGCATVAFCDANGDMLSAIRMARAPEPKKATLKEMLATEVAAILAKRPDLAVMKVADAAADNWDFLDSEALPDGDAAVDFFHASEHLHAAIQEVYGEGTHEARYRYEKLKETLRDEPEGAAKVIRALAHLVAKHPRKAKLKTELGYFRKHRKRMRYADLKAKGLMIGSGIVEAACKTLVTQRLKQSGMRWTSTGAQAVLTARGWDQSERFDDAWALIAATYHAEITVFNNVIAIKPKPEPRVRRSASR